MTNQELYEYLLSVKETYGRLDADVILQVASDKDSPIHNRFEWDDTIAAIKHRQQQARELVRQVMVTFDNYDGRKEVTRAFVVIRGDATEGLEQYHRTIDVLSDEEKRQKYLGQLKDDLDRLAQKYTILEEFSTCLREYAQGLDGGA